jgi:predicted Holliday junction resolvase-like endonuclease
MIYFSAVLIVLIIAVVWNFKSQLEKLKEQHEEELRREITKARKDGKQRSAAVQWGKTIEHFVPFMEEFPIPAEDVVFLGMPIDYVGFTNTGSKTKCEVHFVEVKSGSSFLMGKQKNIKKAIQEGRVHWHEVSVDGNFEK